MWSHNLLTDISSILRGNIIYVVLRLSLIYVHLKEHLSVEVVSKHPGDSFFAELLAKHVSFIASKTVKESSLCAKTMIQSEIKKGSTELMSAALDRFHNLLWYNIKIWIGEF